MKRSKRVHITGTVDSHRRSRDPDRAADALRAESPRCRCPDAECEQPSPDEPCDAQLCISANNGELPTIDGRRGPSTSRGSMVGAGGRSHCVRGILPYIESLSVQFGQQYPNEVPLYKNLADPFDFPIPNQPVHGHAISYAANAQVFVGYPSLLYRTFADGTSQTIMFAEHYFWCGPTQSTFGITDPYKGPSRRPTFADGGSVLGGLNPGDVYPVTSGQPSVTRPSRPGVTFQVNYDLGFQISLAFLKDLDRPAQANVTHRCLRRPTREE